MKAHVVGQSGPEMADISIPEPGPEDILVRTRACALNRADLAMARGVKHGAAGGAGAVLGLEWAGEVVAMGAGVTGFNVGDRVMGSGAAAFAEYVITDFGRCLHMPNPLMSFGQAACLPVGLQTMHDAVVTNGEVGPGQSVLVQGASSGVGLMALQIAKIKGAAKVIGTSTTAERRERLKEFGADLSIDTTQKDWVDQVRAATDGKGVDVVIDQITGKLASETLHATRVLGRIINVGRLGGNVAEFDFDIHARRRISLIGVTFRTRTKQEIREISQRLRADIWPEVAEGRISLPISATFPFADLNPALEMMAANRHFGKIVLEL